MSHPEERSLRPGEELPEPKGDCYDAAFNALFSEFLTRDAVLVHAVCLIGTGPHRGLPFGHAWIEIDSVIEIPDDVEIEGLEGPIKTVECVDRSNGRDLRLPQAFYYMGGRPTQIHRYTHKEAVEKAHESGHSGPWDLNVDR